MVDVSTAPDPSGECCVEGCTNPAEEMWYPDHCALREGGVQVEWTGLCTTHDLQLNLFVTRMFFGKKYDDLLLDYAIRQSMERGALNFLKKHNVQVVVI